MDACRSSLENTRKMNLQSILKKNSLWIHTELVFDMLGVARKLVKYVVQLFRRKFCKKKKIIILKRCPNGQILGILGVIFGMEITHFYYCNRKSGSYIFFLFFIFFLLSHCK